MSIENDVITRLVLPLLGFKRRYSSAERMRRHIARRAVRPVAFAPPRMVDLRAAVSLRFAHDWPVYELAPRGGAPTRHVVYFHGGAYVDEIQPTHWLWLAQLVAWTGCRAVVPIYPLGARTGAVGTVARATELTRELAGEVGPDQVVLMGDSAGGGLALAAAQALRDGGVVVGRLVLISPWLDIAVDLPEQRELDRRDAILGVPGLVECGRAYADGLPPTDPRVTPLHGDMRGLPPIAVFTGTEDVLHPDSRRLHEACAEVDVECELVVEAGMPHDYPLLPTREGRAASRRIAELARAG